MQMKRQLVLVTQSAAHTHQYAMILFIEHLPLLALFYVV